ncbi:Sec1-like protein [Entophlyctis helioformis]|nr:Sec1-like protein [Entophlyctis helioformis]
MSATSLKDILRKRVLEDMVRAVQPASKWKLLVVDGNAAKLLNAICKSQEILQENVTVIEELFHKRPAFPNYEAIYFITPNERSIDRFIADFNQDKPLYLAAHIYFISSLEDALFDRIKKSGTTKFIKNLKEMNIDFIGLEPQVFTVDLPLAPFTIYNPTSAAAQSADLQRAAKRILSLLITIGECPFIRYYDPSGNGNGPCAKLALLLQNELDMLCKVDQEFPPPSEYRRAVLVITDRSFDMMAPLLHEFTYQAMMSDLLIGDGKDVSSPSYASLDENDPIWNLIKHWHFAEAVEYIRESFTKFLSENKAAANALGQADDKPKGIDSLKQMKDTLSSLPQFQEMKSKFSVHINICQECKSLFEKRRLDIVAGVQQDLATGETTDGRVPKNAILDLIPVLDNKNGTPYDKLRTLIIYIIAMEGIQDNERRRLLETAKLSIEDSQAITNLAYYGIQLSPGQASQGRSKAKDKDRYTYWGSHKLDKKRKKNKASNDLPYDLSRYVPLVKRIMEDQITNTLSREVFPWVNEPAPDQLGITTAAPKMFRFTSNGLVAPDPNFPHSLRTTRASWVNRRPAKGQTKSGGNESSAGGGGGQEKQDLRRNGSRIIVFSLGGLTHSEMRTAYEVAKDAQRDVIIGSTYVYNSSQFLDILKHLHKGMRAKHPLAPFMA